MQKRVENLYPKIPEKRRLRKNMDWKLRHLDLRQAWIEETDEEEAEEGEESEAEEGEEKDENEGDVEDKGIDYLCSLMGRCNVITRLTGDCRLIQLQSDNNKKSTVVIIFFGSLTDF